MSIEVVIQNSTYNLTSNYIITTWDDIRMLALIVGVICFVAGWVSNEIRHRLKKRK